MPGLSAMAYCFTSIGITSGHRHWKDFGLHPEVFFWVEDVDKVFAGHKQRGAKIFENPSDRPWDAHQYVIEEPNRYHVKIREPLDEKT
jgi:hypothetical protein